MPTTKKQIRARFRQAVFSRDRFKCRVCGSAATPLDAHHITDRNAIPNGGYVVENGISLCEPCHFKAEHFHATGTALPGFSPDELYDRINSSKDLAFQASARLRG